MKTSDLMSFYKCKTQRDLAKKIGYSEVTLWKWSVNGVPKRTQALFEIKTNGKLKADLKEATHA